MYIFFLFSQNANLRSSRFAPHSSSMSDMAISALSPFTPVSPSGDVFWDSETPPKVVLVLYLFFFHCPGRKHTKLLLTVRSATYRAALFSCECDHVASCHQKEEGVGPWMWSPSHCVVFLCVLSFLRPPSWVWHEWVFIFAASVCALGWRRHFMFYLGATHFRSPMFCV